MRRPSSRHAQTFPPQRQGSPKSRQHLYAGAIIGLALLLSSCSSGPYQRTLKFQGGKELNPTFDASTSKVTVRILQLLSTNAFENAKDELLREGDLDATDWVVDWQEERVLVDSEHEFKIMIQPKVKFLGIVGLFNDKDGEWKDIVEVDQIGESLFVLDKYTLANQSGGGDE